MSSKIFSRAAIPSTNTPAWSHRSPCTLYPVPRQKWPTCTPDPNFCPICFRLIQLAANRRFHCYFTSSVISISCCSPCRRIATERNRPRMSGHRHHPGGPHRRNHRSTHHVQNPPAIRISPPPLHRYTSSVNLPHKDYYRPTTAVSTLLARFWRSLSLFVVTSLQSTYIAWPNAKRWITLLVEVSCIRFDLHPL